MEGTCLKSSTGPTRGITFAYDKSFKLFRPGLFELIDMLCSYHILIHYGNVDQNHPRFVSRRTCEGEVPSNVQVCVQALTHVPMKDVPS